jgi:hypothetical protein
MRIEDIIRTLQVSVAPCVLISGFGFLLLTMTNRLGRASDRIRLLINNLSDAKHSEKTFIKKEIQIIYDRCCYLRNSIVLLVFSIAFVAVNVLMLFLSIVFAFNLSVYIEIIFASSLACLIASLVAFLLDIRLTLRTLKIEIENRQ